LSALCTGDKNYQRAPGSIHGPKSKSTKLEIGQTVSFSSPRNALVIKTINGPKALYMGRKARALNLRSDKQELGKSHTPLNLEQLLNTERARAFLQAT
jgi:hypothetical protein